MQKTQIQSRGWEDTPEKRMATNSSILAWKIPWTAEPGGLQSTGSQRVRHDWVTNPSDFPGGPMVKNLPASVGGIRDSGLIPGSGRSPGGGHGSLLQYSCLENPMGRGAWWPTAQKFRKSWTWQHMTCRTFSQIGLLAWEVVLQAMWRSTMVGAFVMYPAIKGWASHSSRPMRPIDWKSVTLSCFYILWRG